MSILHAVPRTPPGSLLEAAGRGGFLRRSPLRLGEAAGHKEWLHFCIVAPGIHVLINFSLADTTAWQGAPLPGAGRSVGALAPRGFRAHEQARVIALVCQADGWSGGVAAAPPLPIDAIGGAIDLRVGASAVRYVDGLFEVELNEPGLGIVASFRLQPRTWPSVVHNFPLGHERMHWFTLPRLSAHGWIHCQGRRHDIVDAPAYHDHNWGNFSWGGDYAWEWGFALSESSAAAWSLVFLRMGDRDGHRSEVQGLFVWREEEETRLFRDRDLRVRSEGVWRGDRVHKVPGVMALLRPGTAAPIPRLLRLEASSRGDRITALYTPRHVAQILVPNERDGGVTLLNETAGTLQVQGCIAGEPLAFEVETVVEFLGG